MTTSLTKLNDNTQPNPLNELQDSTLSTRWLLNLDEIDGTDLPLVGGKAFRLAMLKQHGFNVPAGLVLTTQFFETQIQHAKLVPLWAGSPDVAVTAEALSWLADALKTKPLFQTLAKALAEQITQVFGPETAAFAVRSSAIDEDQRDHTFAGIHLTELGVPRSAIPIAITRCWASALYGPALEYRQVHGMSIQSIQIAVLIQPMLEPKSAGVGFTVNPLTGARDEMVIEATWGTGNPLVSGDIQPYFYRLSTQSSNYPLLEQHSGNVPTPDNADEDQNNPLSRKEITALARQLEQIQVIMGEAQDVEWARQDETFYILQTRPVSILPELQQQVDQEWTRGNHPEDLPELPSPFFGALLERIQNQALLFYQEIGLKVDNLGPYEKIILGRPYLNLTFLKRGMAQVGINPESFLQTMGYIQPASTGQVFSIDWKTAWKGRRVYRLALQRIFSMRHLVNGTEKIVEAAANILSNPNPDDSSADLIDQLRQQDKIYRALFTTNLGLTLAIGFITGLGSRLIAPITQSPATTISALAMKDVKMSKDGFHQALLSLGQTVRSNEQAKQYLNDLSDKPVGYTQDQKLPTELKRGIEDIMTQYGDRATHEADPSWPRYRDDPGAMLHILQQYVKSNQPVPTRETSITWQKLTIPPTGFNRLFPWRRWLTQPLIGMLQRLFSMRSELDDTRARAIAACRSWDLILGQKWAKQGWLEQPEDIFWLTLDEIERVLMIEQGGAVTLSSTVKARKETYQTYAKTQMPFYLKESQLASIQLGIGLSTESPSDVAIGLPVSPGQARGTVMVVHNPSEFEDISGKDVILVMPSTDPAWLALLSSAAGLIVETGGLLSHGSVIAREYGLPAVANIPKATQQFHTGDIVLVDGSTGVIQVLESSQSTLTEETMTTI